MTSSGDREKILTGGTKAVFLDAGGTLFRPFPSVGYHYSEVAARHGCRIGAEEIEAAFRRVWHEHDGIGDLKSYCDEKVEKTFWRKIVTEVFKDLPGIRVFDTFFEELHVLFGEPSVWRLFPEVEDVLRALKQRGLVLGLVSNWDSRLLKLCAGLGLDPYLDFKVISAAFGAAKPSRRIFEEALRVAGVKAREVVHVGDSLEDDIRGAREAGIRAIWVDRSGRHGSLPPGQRDLVTVIRDLRALI
ncbi:MAG: HAD-IA family hydrolase [Candidatus Omnitrophica bacterium]|nr:HAD-IA family hydrolase [Candidatus Omnitrophota bacterium]